MTNMMTKEELREARRRLGLTQNELAEMIGVKLNTVGKWECGAAQCAGPAAILIRKMVKELRGRVKQPA